MPSRFFSRVVCCFAWWWLPLGGQADAGGEIVLIAQASRENMHLVSSADTHFVDPEDEEVAPGGEEEMDRKWMLVAPGGTQEENFEAESNDARG